MGRDGDAVVLLKLNECTTVTMFAAKVSLSSPARSIIKPEVVTRLRLPRRRPVSLDSLHERTFCPSAEQAI